MNIDDLTIGEAKQLSAMFCQEQKSSNILQKYIGCYVICRSRNAGVNFGRVVAIDSTAVVLENARRMWYHKPIKGAWYEGVARHGLHKDSKLSETVEEKAIVEDYELTIVHAEALGSIADAKVYVR